MPNQGTTKMFVKLNNLSLIVCDRILQNFCFVKQNKVLGITLRLYANIRK